MIRRRGWLQSTLAALLQRGLAHSPVLLCVVLLATGVATSAAAFKAVAGKAVPFGFLPVFNVATGSTQISNQIPVGGIVAATTIAISGGRYSINGGPFTTALGSVVAGDSVAVEVLASSDYATRTRATLTVGNASIDYLVGTRAADAEPLAFAFAPANEALPGHTVASTAISITGIDVPVPVSIARGFYSINGGAFTRLAGTLGDGDRVVVQSLAASTNATTRSARLTIGRSSADFNVTTPGADTVPEAFSFTDQPMAFPGLAAVSNEVTVTGISAPVTASVAGGLYSVNGAPFLAMPGPVSNGDKLRLLVTPGVNLGDVATATLTVSGLSAAFSATTQSPVDAFPDLYPFREVRAPRNSVVYSEMKRIDNINVPVPISIVGGSYSINGSAFITTPSTVKGGDVVQLRVTTGSLYDSRQQASLSIGPVRQTWSVRTPYDPAQIEPFTLKTALIYAPDGRVLPGSVQISEPVTVRNPGGPVAISVDGGSYSVNGGTFVTTQAPVVDGDRVVVAVKAASEVSTETAVTLKIGSVQSTLPVRTILDPVAATPAEHEGCVPYIYRKLAPVPLRLFVCYPAGWSSTDRRSALVEYFGGAFVTGATDRSIDQARYWADTQGMVGIAPDYRVNDRFGTWSYVAADDARAALKWVETNAAMLGIDPRRIAVTGNSGGATVSFMAAVRDAPATGESADTPPFRVAAVISRSGSPDLGVGAEADVNATLARFGGYASAIAPGMNLDLAFPPVLMIHGDRDDKAPATPAVNVCSELIRLGRICEFNSKAGIGHGLASPANIIVVNEDTRLFLLGLGLLPATR